MKLIPERKSVIVSAEDLRLFSVEGTTVALWPADAVHGTPPEVLAFEGILPCELTMSIRSRDVEGCDNKIKLAKLVLRAKRLSA